VEAKELGVKSGRGWYDYKGMSREEIRGKTNENSFNNLFCIIVVKKQKTRENRLILPKTNNAGIIWYLGACERLRTKHLI